MKVTIIWVVVFVFLLVSVFLVIYFSKLSTAQSQSDWWNASWHHRIPVTLNSTAYERNNTPIEIRVNFTQELANQGVQGAFDNNSVRILEYNASGNILYEVPSQFDPDEGYSTSNAIGTVIWAMNGTTSANTVRYYFIYFDSMIYPKLMSNYATNLTYSWGGKEILVNNTFLEIRIDTNRSEYTSGIYYAKRLDSGLLLFNTPSNERTAEYVQYYNGTRFAFNIMENATFISGPVRLVIEQNGEEFVWNKPSQTTNEGLLTKRYTFYSNTPWIKIEQIFTNNDSQPINRTSNGIRTLALETKRAFNFNFIDGNISDPYAWQSTYSDSTSKGLGVINTNESNTTNYQVGGDPFFGVGIQLATTEINPGSSIAEEAVILLNNQASHTPVEDLRNRFETKVNVTMDPSESYQVISIPATDFSVYNRNGTAIITVNITEDTFNLTTAANATLDRGTPSTSDDITIVLYDDGLNGGDQVSGDNIYTTNFTFSVTDVAGVWNVTIQLYGSEDYLLNQSFVNVNVTNQYTVNVTVLNPTGVTNRSLYANVTVFNYRNDTGIEGASVSCAANSSPVTNITDDGNGNYSLNFTAPSGLGTFFLSCNATQYNNTGFGEDMFTTEDPTTSLVSKMTPALFVAGNITQSQNKTFDLTALLNNTGNATAVSASIFLSLPGGWSSNTSIGNCGDIPITGSCMTLFQITIPAGSLSGNYTINITANWTNSDSSIDSLSNQSTVTVLSNPLINVTRENITSSVGEGNESTIGNVTVQSIGNDALENVTFTCFSGEVCTNFTLKFSPSIISGLSGGNQVNVSVNATVPEGYAAGNYLGTVNISSQNNGFALLNISLTVPDSLAWERTPPSCQQTAIINSTGTVCTVTINATGNQPLNFTLSPLGANFTTVNKTSMNMSPQSSDTFQIFFNTSGASQTTYTAQYLINASVGASPSSQNVSVTLITVIGPSIESETTSQGEQTSIMEIRANVTDFSIAGVDFVQANITKPDSSLEQLVLVNLTPNTPGAVSIWSANFSNTSLRGVYNITFYAGDNMGGSAQITDNFTVFAKLVPTINIVLSPSNVWGSFFITVKDGINNSIANANVSVQVNVSDVFIIFNDTIATNNEGVVNPPPVFNLLTEGTYNWSVSLSFFDPTANMTIINETKSYFAVSDQQLGIGLSLDIVAPAEIAAGEAMPVIAVTTNNGNNINVDTARVSLFDPLDNLIVDDVSMTQQSMGVYIRNYTTSGSSTQGSWKWDVTITENSDIINSFVFTRLIGGPFDVRDIQIQDNGIPNLAASVVVENTGLLGQDVSLQWNVTREDTGTQLDAGLDTFFVGPVAELTRTVFPETSYIGQVRITFLLTFSGTEKVGAFEIFTTTPEATPPTPPSGGGPSGEAMIVVTGDIAETVAEVSLEIIAIFPQKLEIEAGGIRYVSVEVKNTGNVELTDISASLQTIPLSWTELMGIIALLSPGKTGTLILKIEIPENTSVRTYQSNLKVVAKEASDEKPYSITVFESRESLVRHLIEGLKISLHELEIRVSQAALEKNITTVLSMLEKANQYIWLAEKDFEARDFVGAIEHINKGKGIIDEANYVLSIIRPPKLLSEPPVIGYLFFVIFILLVIIIAEITYTVLRKTGKVNYVNKLKVSSPFIHKKVVRESGTKVNGGEHEPGKENSHIQKMLNTIENQLRNGIISEETYKELKGVYEKKLSQIEKQSRK